MQPCLIQNICTGEVGISTNWKMHASLKEQSNACLRRILPEGSLWCNGPCWSTGGTSSWVGVFCWVSWALKTRRGLRNGPSGSWVHPLCCSGSHRGIHSYKRCCSRPRKHQEEAHFKHSNLTLWKYVIIFLSLVDLHIIFNGSILCYEGKKKTCEASKPLRPFFLFNSEHLALCPAVLINWKSTEHVHGARQDFTKDDSL